MSMTKKDIFIGLDFDGTVADHDFPDIGKEIPYAFDWLKKYQHMGAKILLNTIRSDDQMAPDGITSTLDAAVKFLNDRGINLFGVNKNPIQKAWSSSPKVYAHYYIDDLGIGTPLIKYPEFKRECVDWTILGPMCQEKILTWIVKQRLGEV